MDAEEDSVVQPFLDSLMPDADSDMPGPRRPDASALDALDTGMVDTATLAKIAQILSAFGSLMYDMLLSRPHAVGAFAVGLVSHG